jgi:hypothetical protein
MSAGSQTGSIVISALVEIEYAESKIPGQVPTGNPLLSRSSESGTLPPQFKAGHPNLSRFPFPEILATSIIGSSRTMRFHSSCPIVNS